MYRRFFLLLAASAGLLAFVLLRDSEPAPRTVDVPPSQVVATPVLPQPEPPPAVPPQSEPPAAAPAAADDAQFAGLEVWLGRLKTAATAQAHLEILQQAAAREPRARFLALIARQLRSGKSNDRVAALQALSGLSGEDVIPFYKQGLVDTEAGIREITRRSLHGLDASSRIEVLTSGLSSPYEAVRIDCFRELTQETSKQVIPALIHALGSGNPATSSEAARQLETRLGPSAPVFKQSGAAKAWWDENAHRYGDDLRRLD